MPSYEDQLGAYRAQLASIASSQAQTAASAGTGPMAAAGLAFNSMMADVARAAAFVHTVPSTPGFYGVPISGKAPYNMGLGEALWAVAGPGMPSSPMYADDYRYLATARLSRFSDSAATGLLTGGGGLVAGIGAGAAAGAAFGSIFPGAGTAVGGLVGAVVGGVASYAVSNGLAGQAGNISNLSDTIRSVTPMVFGGSGLSAGVSRDIAKMANRSTISQSQSWLGSPSDQLELSNLALQGGAKYGLFSGTTDTDSFKKEFSELTRVIRDVANTLRMSREEIVPLIAEMRQGGFYGASSAQSGILAGSGMAYGAGLNFGSMHEAGLRGAAIFRGTGVPAQFGYQTAQASLFQVSRMQQMGMVSPEVINQLGGRSGAADALTQGTAMFTQGPLGRASVAMLMDGQGGINQGALNTMLSGGNPMAALNLASIDPAATLNPMNVGRVWANLGPEKAQMLQAAWMNSYAKMYQGMNGGNYENNFGLAFRQVAPMLGVEVNAGNMGLYMGMAQNLPQLQREQRNAEYRERERAASDAYQRKYDFWEDTGVRGFGRGIRRRLTPVGEGISDLGSGVANVARNVSDFFTNSERVTTRGSDLASFAARDPGLLSSDAPTTAVLTRQDHEFFAARGKLGFGAGMNYSPTRGQVLGGMLTYNWDFAKTVKEGDYAADMRTVRSLVNYGDAKVSAESEAEIAGKIGGALGAGTSSERKKLAQQIQEGSQDPEVQAKLVSDAQAAISEYKKKGGKASDEEVIAVLANKRYAASADSVRSVVGNLGMSGTVYDVNAAKEGVKSTREKLSKLGLTSDTTGEWGAYSDEAEAYMNTAEFATALEDWSKGGLSDAQFHKKTGNRFDLADLSKMRGKDRAAVIEAATAHRQAAGRLTMAEAGTAAFSEMDRGLTDAQRKTDIGQAISMAGKAQGQVAQQLLAKAMDDPKFAEKYKDAEGGVGDIARQVEFRAELSAKLLGVKGDSAAAQEERLNILNEGGVLGAKDLAAKQLDKTGWHQALAADLLTSQARDADEKQSANASERLSAQAGAYRPGGRDMQFETMKELYTAVKALNEKIK